VRDFRGWLWQEGRCIEPAAGTPACPRRSFLSVRLPVEVFRDALIAKSAQWPPPDLDRMTIRLRLLAPGDAQPLFDSDTPGATLPFSLAELRGLLLPGEKLTVQRAGSPRPLFELTGAAPDDQPISPWIAQVIRRLPVDGFDAPVQAREVVDTSLGRHELVLTGDIRLDQPGAGGRGHAPGLDRGRDAARGRLHLGPARAVRDPRITLLTKRAAAVSLGVRGGDGLASLDLSDLRGGDELGVLAQGLKDLLQRVNDDVRREQIRARQEQEMWHAVGHEIMSPLQSLMALHGGRDDDPSARYISRMQQAVRVLYGQASPSEAFESTTLALETVDLDAFLGHVAGNAGYIGIERVEYARLGTPVLVRADEHSLEDVVTHVLRNADRHRTPGTPIRITLAVDGQSVQMSLHNQGPSIPEDSLGRIFEYGVSDAPDAAAAGRRGQGLFVARTYMSKMGGTIVARNESDGVAFVLSLPPA
jgi:signal transduction histidine kinase